MEIPHEEYEKLTKVPFSDGEEPTEEVEETQAEEEQVKVEEKVSVSPDEDTVADEARIPYSRFNTVNEEKIRAQERAKLLEEELNRYRTSESSTKVEDEELPAEWVELYGDSDSAKRAYSLQQKQIRQLEDKAAERAYERLQQERKKEEELISQNVKEIENQLQNFQESLGRKLTKTEEDAVLSIQDEFTQKDKDGKYLTPLLSPEKAFEIHTLRQEKVQLAKKQAKNRAVAATSAGSEGDTSLTPGANYNPNQWGGWRDKLAE